MLNNNDLIREMKTRLKPTFSLLFKYSSYFWKCVSF